MEALCSSLKNLFAFRRDIVIDTLVFRLHYRLTFAILLVLSFTVGFRQIFGTTIKCIGTDDFPSRYIEEYCYTHSTFSIEEAWDKKVGEKIPYPGIVKYSPQETRIEHTYYQWVAIALFVHAVFFLVPRCFWKHMESGRVRDIAQEIAKFEASREDFKHQSLVCSTRRICAELQHNWSYFGAYEVAEVLNLVNVIVQFYLMDVFLGGHFFSYGQQVLQFPSLLDPGFKRFPGIAKCNIYKYGRSGDVQLHSPSCLLPINILNGKIYAFLWFWFVMLCVVSCLSLLWCLVFSLSSRFRVSRLVSGRRLLERKHVEMAVQQMSAADCFFLYLISHNIGSATFRDVVSSLAKEDLSSQKFSEDETTLM